MDKIYELLSDHEHDSLRRRLLGKGHVDKVLHTLNENLDIPINYAAREGCIDCCSILMEAGSTPGHDFYIGELGVFSPLFVAAGKDQLECMKWLIDNGFPMDPMPYLAGVTLFTYTIHRRAKSTFSYLLDKVDLNLAAPNGATPMVESIGGLSWEDDSFFAKSLVEHGANIDNLESLISLASGKGHRIAYNYLCSLR